MSLFHHLEAKTIEGVKDLIPAYTTLTVVYNILLVKKLSAITAYKYICDEIENNIAHCDFVYAASTKVIEIPVCYHINFAPDLMRIAHEKNLSTDVIINIHISAVYDVYMLGFLPGFAYMGFVDERIAMPRLANPRPVVAAGSVGIANNQTGVYPLQSPGGWNIIGRTPLKIFDAAKEKPCLLQPGGRVKFVSINMDDFENLKQDL